MSTEPVLQGSMWSGIRLAYGLLSSVNLLERHGIDPVPLLARAEIDRFGLMDPAYTISIEQELAVLRGVAKALEAPAVSLLLAQEYRLRNFSVLGLAMQCCDTPMQLFGLLLTYPRLAWGVLDCSTEWGRSTLSLVFSAPPGIGGIEGFLVERDLANARVILDEVMQEPAAFETVEFRHDCDSDPSLYEAFFRCPVRFGAPRHAVTVRQPALTTPLPHANPALRTFYEAQCARMSGRLEQPFSFGEAVRGRLARSSPIPALPQLAAEFYMTPRTMQRRLAAEGASFSDILREVRQQRAGRLLDDTPRDMEGIAAELGLSGAVAFSRAYKQWTGEAPQQRRLRAAGRSPRRG